MQPIKIASLQNNLIKELTSLKQKKFREKYNKFLIEGKKTIDEAINSKTKLNRVIFTQSYFDNNPTIIEDITKIDTQAIIVEDYIMNKISDTLSPQGIIAELDTFSYDISNIFGKQNRFVILENIQDPGNMGTIIRTCDAFGIDGIIVSHESVDVLNPKLVRATMGSIFHIPIVNTKDIYEDIRLLKDKGIRIIASHPRAQKNCFEERMNCNTAIMIGNEGHGLSKESLEIADSLVKIPMKGMAESLNASIASAILIYEMSKN